MQLTYPLGDTVTIPAQEADGTSQFQLSTDTPAQARTSVAVTAKPAADQVIGYLSPFLVLTALSQTTAVFAGPIDWLYPLAVLGVLTTLWMCRSAYRILDSNVGTTRGVFAVVAWEPLVLGLAVAAAWVWSTQMMPNPAWVAALQAGPKYGDAWLAIRLVGFALAVPIAVELAFRGYLPRRLMSDDVDAVASGTFGWMSFLASSVWFGALQGPHWLIGTLQGMAYAAALYRRGRVTDAILAHIVTNVALVAYAFNTGHWSAIL